MSLFDFFFPEQAQASHLRKLSETNSMANTQARLARARTRAVAETSAKRVEELEGELAELTIIVEALLEKLSEDGTVTRADLARTVAEIDARDGVIDGKITKHEPPTEEDGGSKLRFPK